MSKRTYTLRPIRTQADYDEALKLVEPFFDSDPDPDSDEGAYFDAGGNPSFATVFKVR